MSFPVVKGAGYFLAHTPEMIVRNGSTSVMERITNPESDFLKNVGNYIRSYDEVVNYLPNQVYIGNVRPEELDNHEMPWCEVEHEGKRQGKFGEIAPEDEFIAVMQICDVFDLVILCEDFVEKVRPKIEKNYPALEPFFKRLKGKDISKGKELIKEGKAEPLVFEDELVGYVKEAHNVDVNLNAHTMHENIVVKASGVLSVLELFKAHEEIKPTDIDYIIECSEEAAGDINQRGGGNIAKSIAEMAGLENASGSDTRSFCAAPVHAMIEAAALVKAGIYDNVMVVAGGSTAKLGMNAKNHITKELPVLEDVVAGFATVVSKNDGVSPVIRTDIIGKHNVGTGSAPQAVMSSLITKGLDEAGLNIADIDTYSVEMQNPDITKPAGAGNVPEANYKMIAALAVGRGEIERAELLDFTKQIGLPGWAPTQGHIPSGVPYLGFGIEDMTTGDKDRAMIVGKGSLFLGRLTNLFDGVSFVVERNTGEMDSGSGMEDDQIRGIIAESMRKMAQDMMEE